MKKLLLLLSTFLLSLNLQARTEGRFLGQQYIINLLSNSIDGSYDETPARIYQQMNVEEKQSMLGNGKTLTVSKKEMTFICNKKAANSFHCSFLIFNSPFGKISFKSAIIKYTGAEAAAVFTQFFPNQDGSEINITDDTGQLNLIVRPDLFQLKFQAN